MKPIFLLLAAALTLFSQTYMFSDGGTQIRVDAAPDQIYIAIPASIDRIAALANVKKSLGTQVRSVIETGAGGYILTLTQPELAQTSTQSVRTVRLNAVRAANVQTVAPVFYDSTDNPESRRDGARRIVTAKLLVKMSGDEDWTRLQGTAPALTHAESLIKGWQLVEFRDPYTAFAAAETLLTQGGWEFSPVFARQYEKRGAASGALQRPVSDPLFAKQWNLANATPGIHMNAAWDVATGRGVDVAVVDDGLEVAHEDLLANTYPLATNYHRNFNDGEPNDPTPLNPGQNHGTNCAGIIAAAGFNNIGVIGVAPEARLMGLRLIAGMAGDDATGAAMAWQPDGVVTSVSSNSWGPTDDGMDQGRMSAQQTAGIAQANTYRSGLGTIFAVSAGNGRDNGDDASYDDFASSRFTIGVGAINREGKQSSYSESGINVAIAAPGGEFQAPGVVWTTNNSGDEARASLKSKNPSLTAPVNYTDVFNGTSAAAPHVSGAAALLLQVNPKLGYRDVKEILMKSAAKEGLQGEAFMDNKAGFSFSHAFGAGLLNVSAALDLAANWTNLGPLETISTSENGSLSIPDGSIDGATFHLDFSAQPPVRVEHVEFTVNVKHANRGEIGFILTSPSGMTSIVNNRTPDKGADFNTYTFTSVRHWGETSTGIWTLKVIDTVADGVTGSARNISMHIYGTAVK
jgi:subtilisin family serine protease